MRVAIYLRVSTEEQRDRQTIATQRDFAERYCELHQIPIFDYYADDGVTGTIALDQRPEGLRLLNDAKSKRFDTVMVYKIDRLGRNARLILNAVEDLESLGLQVKSMTEPVDTSTPAGRFMLTILAAVAAMERDTIVERSINGTNRLARQGAWLGGIVPYGYRVEGRDREARLVISDEPLPGLAMSEADVIRLIYRKATDERKSCVAISDLLNSLGVPPSYTKDQRHLLRGKRKETTSGIWRPSRVRNMIASTTYKGLHQYGKRSKKQREIIERTVPAIVSPQIWERAQQTLRSNMIFGKQDAKRKYLLRGVIKCGMCGLTYVGVPYRNNGYPPQVYYVCNGKQNGRGLYALQGKRCPSKAIPASIEQVIWQDIEEFLRNPGEVLHYFNERLQHQPDTGEAAKEYIARLTQVIAGKQKERDTVITLFRKGRIDGTALDIQLDQIDREENELKTQLDELSRRTVPAEVVTSQLRSVETLLLDLNQALDQPVSWEIKRRLIETLVESIKVDTREEEGIKMAEVNVTYCFSPSWTATPINYHKDTDS